MLLNFFFQRPAGNVFHDNIVSILVASHIIHIDDIRMGQFGRRLRFPAKAADKFLVVSKLLVQHFDGNRTFQKIILRTIYRSHAAAANFLQQFITMSQYAVHH